jgi:serine/threonine-protein kinase HipA
MFGKPILPIIPITLPEISFKAQQLAGKLSISGVQPKLSVRLDGNKLLPVVRDGQFILKPQTQEFSELPQNEYLCMQMGKKFGINTADCLLLELPDGSLSYLVKRFDRARKGQKSIKIHCEDMQQILGGRDKYSGSHEQIAGAILEHCTFAPLELQRLFDLTVFNFVIGNGDAHKKNFSLLTKDGHISLSPVYDLVSSRTVLPEETDEIALTIGGRKNRLSRRDFEDFAEYIKITTAYTQKRISGLISLQDEFCRMITASTLTQTLQDRFTAIVTERLSRLKNNR